MFISKVWGVVCGVLLGYETQKVVQIHSKTIGLFFRLIQLGIIVYFVGWVMVHERGYQYPDEAISGVTAKVKGIGITNDTFNGWRIWDPADYVVPPQQKAAFFVMTKFVVTNGQRLGNCEEDHLITEAACNDSKSQCKEGETRMHGNGMNTGKCVDSKRAIKKGLKGAKVCEIYGWCPVEDDSVANVIPHLAAAENFTVLLKNSIEFPFYKVKRRNIFAKTKLHTCTYDPHNETNKFCPIFRLGDIIKLTNVDDGGEIWKKGGQVSIHIEWDCDLDRDVAECRPKYTFRRLDYDPKKGSGKGWNFRFAQHYRQGDISYRNLVKAFGIQFFVESYGKGYKFSILTFSMNLGSGLALLGMATVLCDMIVLNITGKRNIYRKAKVDKLSEEDRDHHNSAQDSGSILNGRFTKRDNQSVESLLRVNTSPVNPRIKSSSRSTGKLPTLVNGVDTVSMVQSKALSKSFDSFHPAVPQTIMDSLKPINPKSELVTSQSISFRICD
ncbi:purinergic receptor P2X, ligand-gated ion channel [Cichlidogyrus casuarinus]|uniref:Purinergic receptor P2X, ligand-gated ion channel n=1 Tax=Cichlidogyrus casuarinus TaxID=1844966 RepID=A0ABD2PV98_9PLAT